LSRRLRAGLSARAAVARAILAALLICATTAGAVPFGAIAAAAGCPMPCCTGIYGEDGCAGGTCHAHLGKHTAQAAEAAPASASEDSSAALGGMEHAQHTLPESSHTHHAPPESSRAHASYKIEHAQHQHVPAQNTAPREAHVGASIARSCAPDCGALLNSFTQQRRSHDGAALAHGLRPRPLSPAATRRAPAGVVKISYALRRLCPPRAPPSAHTSLSA
jgi:hypothetical protein